MTPISPRAHHRARPRAVAFGVGVVAAILCLVSLTSVAGAQGGAALVVREINSTEPGAVKADLLYDGNASDLGSPKVNINGTDVQAKSSKLDLAANKAAVSIVIAPGPNLSGKAAIESARTALKKLVTDAPEGVAFTVTVAGATANRLGDFTSNKDQIANSLDQVGTQSGKVALLDALRLAALPFANDSTRQPNILVVVGDGESASATPDLAFVNARGTITNSGSTMFVAELSDTFDATQVNSLVTDTGGFIKTATDAAGMSKAIADLGTIMLNQQRVEFDSGLQDGQVADINISVGDQTKKSSVRIGGDPRGTQRLQPREVTGGGGLPLLDGSIGLVLVIVLTMIGASLMAYAITLLVVADDSLSSVLQPYADGYSSDEEDEDASALGRSALIQRAVELTEQVATNQGYLGRAEEALERANVPLRAAEALTGYLGLVVVATIFGLIYTRNLIAGLVFGVIAAMLPVGVLNFIASRRRKKFMGQLPDTLQLLSGTLRAGYSLMQGIEAVSQEVEDPMGLELRRVMTESRLGRPVEESLEASAERMDSPDFAWAVMAIRIQREVGGNLSELLLTVAETMTARERLRREVAALTAEGRMSAWVLGLLPPGLGLAMFVINPDYTRVLFTDGLGIALLILAGVAMMIGFAWMRKIINIEI